MIVLKGRGYEKENDSELLMSLMSGICLNGYMFCNCRNWRSSFLIIFFCKWKWRLFQKYVSFVPCGKNRSWHNLPWKFTARFSSCSCLGHRQAARRIGESWCRLCGVAGHPVVSGWRAQVRRPDVEIRILVWKPKPKGCPSTARHFLDSSSCNRFCRLQLWLTVL